MESVANSPSRAARVVLAASYFRQRFMDMIQFTSGGPPDFIGSFANLTEAESNGFEGEVSVQAGSGWSGSASYTIAEPRVKRVSGDYDGDLRPGDALISRPKHAGSGTVSWSGPKSSLSATAM